MGLSFAIPIDVAVDVANQLKTDGRVRRGRIGVVIQEVTAELADSFGLDKPRGALVSRVEKGQAASKAGIQTSDIILTFDGSNVETSNDLPRIVGQTRPGKKVDVEVWRDKRSRTLSLTVGEIPADITSESKKEESKNVSMNVIDELGLMVSDMDMQELKQLELDSGVKIDRVAGVGEQAGLRPGDIVLALNNDDVESVSQFKLLMERYKDARSVALLIQRGGGSLYVPIRLKSK